MATGLIEEVLRLNAGQASGQLRTVATEAVAADKAIEQVGTATQSAGGKANAAGGSFGQLAYQLNDVATMAALGANPMQILASQGGQIAQVFGQMGGPLGVAKAGLAALAAPASAGAVALGALAVVAELAGAAYVAYKVALDDGAPTEAEAAERVAHLTAMYRELEPAIRDTEDAQLRLAVATGELTAEQGKIQAAMDAATRSIEDFANANDAARTAAEETLFSAERLTDRFKAAGLGFEGGTKAVIDWAYGTQGARQALADLDAQERDHQTIVAEGLDATKEAISLEEKHRAATKAVTDAKREAAKALREERQEQAAWIKLQKELAAELDRQAKARTFIDSVAAGGDPVAAVDAEFRSRLAKLKEEITTLKELGATTEDLARAQQAVIATLDAYKKAKNEAYGQMVSTADTPVDSTANPDDARNKALGTAATVTNAISDPLGAISAANPIAAAVVAGLQAAARLPETLSSVSDLFASAIDNISSNGASGVASFAARFVSEMLPKLITAGGDFAVGLVEQIPRLLEAAASAIGPLAVALVENLTLLAPRIAIALAETLLNPQTWIDAGRALGEGFIAAIGALLDAIKDLIEKILPGRQFGGNPSQRGLFTGGGFFDDAERTLFRPGQNAEGGPSKAAAFFSSVGASISDAFAGVFDDGASYVNRSGLAVVHAGEEIVQRGGRRSAAAAMEAGSTSGGTARLTGRGGRLHLELDPAELYRALSHSGSALGLAGAFPLGG